MSEYTKGPWKQHHLKNYVNIVDDRDYCVTSICKVDSNGENDAHLISACPTMYEALNAFKSAFENGVIKTNDLATEVAIESAIELGQKALAKAEGKS